MFKSTIFFALLSALTVEGQDRSNVYSSKVLPNPNACLEPKESGMCEGYFPRFFYNSTSGKCEQFIYGGCQANGNNFLTLIDCQTSCEKNVCLEPKKVGPCRAAIDRYFYDTVSQRCQLFSWGGCSPNGNNFLSRAACQRSCEVKSCNYQGRWYPDGAKLPTSSPCELCNCYQGQVSCGVLDCAQPTCPNPITLPGQCCPVCRDRD